MLSVLLASPLNLVIARDTGNWNASYTCHLEVAVLDWIVFQPVMNSSSIHFSMKLASEDQRVHSVWIFQDVWHVPLGGYPFNSFVSYGLQLLVDNPQQRTLRGLPAQQLDIRLQHSSSK